MDLTLRPPQAADYQALAGWVPDAAAALRWAGPLVRWPYNAEMLATFLIVPASQSRVLAIADDDTPLGFGQYWPRDDGAVHLGRLITAPGLRRQGHGRTLVQRLMTEARSTTGATRVTLRVYRDNAAAMALYHALGFQALPELSDEAVLFMQHLPG
ncbi:GNAT family N-acetyltransferase [Aquabacterium sp.]|uniref:GNAT family N-acetyltransferase n=1 Tax=Aquabacterium sp. TaxID=1872578 RepID=UPI002D0B01CC|nr:GNAT family N-acetyltransferase [Aquabacterium sp.]HSW05952.1 GNAT family N-acetyltransferase [Aquabacterium sp.]